MEGLRDLGIREIEPGELLERVLDDTFPVWGDGLSRRGYGQWNLAQLKTRWGQDHLHRVGLVDGDVVLASAKRYLFDGLVDDRPVKILGIGAVFTPEAHRGRGLAAELIQQMMIDGSARGCTWALLFSEIGPEYYERLGFTTLRRDMVTIEVPRTRRGAPGTMVRALAPGDLSDLASISMSYTAGAGFALNRTPDLIEYAISRRRLRAGCGPSGLRQVETFVAEEGSRAAAYIVVSSGPEGVILEECGDRDPRGSRIGALLEAFVERDPSNPDRTLRAWMPPGLHPPQLPFSDPTPADEVMMVRSITPADPPTREAAQPPAREAAHPPTRPSAHPVWWPIDVF
jgi:GNAT superfamily N-acetyltransferase